jgi:hypothetical protein
MSPDPVYISAIELLNSLGVAVTRDGGTPPVFTATNQETGMYLDSSTSMEALTRRIIFKIIAERESAAYTRFQIAIFDALKQLK